MIGIRGAGANIPITDATATASDIVSGKVAYNNNGRIVGTHTESKITDATASASDIVSGKVAYNNYGRIVGTHTESKITDATASASDIVSGKVAYNNYGRIVGTHTESKITDATASASDIVSGKVAYNNYGRVTGTLDTSSMMKTYTINIPASTYNWTGKPSTISSASGSMFLDFPMDPFTTEYLGTNLFYNDIYVWSEKHTELLQKAVILNHTNLSSLNITDILGLKWPSVHDNTELEMFLKFSYPSDFLHFRIDLQNKRYISDDYETTTNPYVDVLVSKNDIYIYVDSNSTSFVTSVTTTRAQLLTLYYR